MPPSAAGGAARCCPCASPAAARCARPNHRCTHLPCPSSLPTLAFHQVLRSRLRQMELELVKLRAEQAERSLAEARHRQQLSTAAKLE